MYSIGHIIIIVYKVLRARCMPTRVWMEVTKKDIRLVKLTMGMALNELNGWKWLCSIPSQNFGRKTCWCCDKCMDLKCSKTWASLLCRYLFLLRLNHNDHILSYQNPDVSFTTSSNNCWEKSFYQITFVPCSTRFGMMKWLTITSWLTAVISKSRVWYQKVEFL